MRRGSSVVDSDISTIRSQPDYHRSHQLRGLIKHLERELEKSHENRTKLAGEHRLVVQQLQQEHRRLKEKLGQLTKQQTLSRLQASILSEQHEQSNDHLAEASRSIAMAFDRKRLISTSKVQLMRNLSKTVKDYERCCTSTRILTEQAKKADSTIQQHQQQLQDIMSTNNRLVEKLALANRQLREKGEQLQQLEAQRVSEQDRYSTELQLIEAAGNDVEEMKRVHEHNVESCQNYNFLIKTQRSKNESKLHSIEDHAVEEDILNRELQCHLEVLNNQEQTSTQQKSQLRELQQGLQTLQELIYSTQQEIHLLSRTNAALSDQLIGLTQNELTVVDSLSSTKQRRQQLYRKFKALLC